MSQADHLQEHMEAVREVLFLGLRIAIIELKTRRLNGSDDSSLDRFLSDVLKVLGKAIDEEGNWS